MRTCIGCRERCHSSTLIRLVCDDQDLQKVVVSADGASHGRGAHVHPDVTCLELAQKRQAFARAFRRSGPFDTESIQMVLS